MPVPLSTDLDDPEAYPYFLWDDPMTVEELHRRLAGAEDDRWPLIGKILREARDTEVWRFTTPGEVAEHWDELKRHLGLRLPFWEFLLGSWKSTGWL
jgi:hypothetical protein